MAKRHVLTFFTNSTCHLCDIARQALTSAQATLKASSSSSSSSSTPFSPSSSTSALPQRTLQWQEININSAGQEEWKDKYCFDVPVIHFEGSGKSKLMHWIYEEDVLRKLEEVEGPSSGWKTSLGKKK